LRLARLGARLARLGVQLPHLARRPPYRLENNAYKPFPRVVLLDQNIDVDNLVGISAVPPPLTESVEQVEVLGDGKDEELVLCLLL